MNCVKSIQQHPRLLIWTLFCLGSLIWHLPFPAVAVVAAGATCAMTGLFLWEKGKLLRGLKPLLPAYLFFALLWGGGKAGLGLYNGLEPDQALLSGLDLVLRSLVIAASGIGLLALLSPCVIARETGLSLRRIIPSHYWKLSLALLLMLAFIHSAVTAWPELRRTLQLRARGLGLYQKIRLSGQVMLRLLSRQAWERTLCIAGRSLDRPEAWH